MTAALDTKLPNAAIRARARAELEFDLGSGELGAGFGQAVAALEHAADVLVRLLVVEDHLDHLAVDRSHLAAAEAHIRDHVHQLPLLELLLLGDRPVVEGDEVVFEVLLVFDFDYSLLAFLDDLLVVFEEHCCP